ncbi:MAG: 1-(5-phosphoribosyl)-5-[(5-phosphoribosylamino)methylideneamino]imidazole-4-carboxamide isomerase [Christensenellales bacterium]|jgi:phosphoribosylformimino-5-aminoimidazole carboxamide ribotide isomerase
MILFPAIDILDRNAVRLLYGDRRQTTIYGDPVAIAERWVDCEAEYLHVVDLNAAFGDDTVNTSVLKDLFDRVKVPIQIGGGIRSIDKIKYYIEELGAYKIILGTGVVEKPEFFEEAARLYADKIIVGIDVKNGKVAIKGWVDKTDMTALELAQKVVNMGIDTVIYTDISRDGALSGVNIINTTELREKSGLNVIASGGIKSLADIKELIANRVYGAVLGKAIYAGNIDLRTALQIVRGIDAD